METITVIINGEVRQAPAECDAFTMYTMAQNPPLLVKLVDGQAIYIQRTHSPLRLTVGSVFESRRWIDGV